MVDQGRLRTGDGDGSRPAGVSDRGRDDPGEEVMDVIKVRTHYGWAFDVRFGEFHYWVAHNNPHPNGTWSVYPDNGILLVFDSSEMRDAMASVLEVTRLKSAQVK
jgi:hypothetical protein